MAKTMMKTVGGMALVISLAVWTLIESEGARDFVFGAPEEYDDSDAYILMADWDPDDVPARIRWDDGVHEPVTKKTYEHAPRQRLVGDPAPGTRITVQIWAGPGPNDGTGDDFPELVSVAIVGPNGNELCNSGWKDTTAACAYTIR